MGPPLGLGLWGRQSLRASLPVCSGGEAGGSGKMPQDPVTSGGPFSAVPSRPGQGGCARGAWSSCVRPGPSPSALTLLPGATAATERAPRPSPPAEPWGLPFAPCACWGSRVGSGHSPGSLSCAQTSTSAAGRTGVAARSAPTSQAASPAPATAATRWAPTAGPATVRPVLRALPAAPPPCLPLPESAGGQIAEVGSPAAPRRGWGGGGKRVEGRGAHVRACRPPLGAAPAPGPG